MAQSATRTNEMRAISDESASAAIGDPTVVGTQSRASVHTNSSATALARRLKGLVRAVLPRCRRSVWPLAITLLVTVLSAGSGVGAAGLVAAAHPAGTPRAPSALPAGLVAALHCALRALPDAHSAAYSAAWGVPRGERPAHYRLPQQGPRDRAVNPVQGSGPPPARAARKGIAFTPPGLPLPPTGTTAHAVLINPWAQQNRLSAADATGGDNAGLSVVLSGTTAVVGVPGKNGSTGAAYVFVHSGTHWSQQARLTASDGVAGDQFGFSVALSGDAAMVGAPFKNTQTGAAYVFVRRGTGWHQQDRLTASGAAGGDWFGSSVALSGSTALIGAPQRNSSSGAAYMFVRRGTAWHQQTRLTAGDAAAMTDFGSSVALNGSTALVGAPQRNSSSGAAYVFVPRGTGWHQQARLTAGDAAANDELGTSLALSGNTAVVGAPGKNIASGAAYVFVRRGTAWHQQARLTAGDAAEEDNVGLSVAVSADTAVAGAPGQNGSSGAGYVFVRSGTTWYQQTRLTAGHTAAGDDLGTSVALSGNTALVGAPGKSSSTGAVYVLVHGGTRWSQQARPTRPTAADATAGDRFGFSMAVGGAGALVGAPGKGSASGAAYVFVPSGAGWHQQARLSANDAAVSARFGFSVAFAGDTALIGAPGTNGGAGAAYMFVRSGAGWRQQARLSAGDATAGGQFGFSVAFAGDTALIGAPGTNGGAGAAYMFVRSGTRWRQHARLSDSDSLAGDELGTAVSLSRNTALVGAGAPFNTHAGAAYVFVRSGTGWRQQVKLTASDGAAGDQFGLSAALSGSTAMVGAPFNMHAGAAYVFVRSGTGWRQQVKLTASDGAAGDQFGLFVALSGASGLVGAPGKNTSTGVTYAFVHSALTANAPEPQSAG